MMSEFPHFIWLWIDLCLHYIAKSMCSQSPSTRINPPGKKSPGNFSRALPPLMQLPKPKNQIFRGRARDSQRSNQNSKSGRPLALGSLLTRLP